MTDRRTITTITDEYIAVSTYTDGELQDRTEIGLSELGFVAPPGEEVDVQLLATDGDVECNDPDGWLDRFEESDPQPAD